MFGTREKGNCSFTRNFGVLSLKVGRFLLLKKALLPFIKHYSISKLIDKWDQIIKGSFKEWLVLSHTLVEDREQIFVIFAHTQSYISHA